MTTTEPTRGTVLVLGGARSGKSTWAEARVAPNGDVDYLATSAANPEDPEWTERIRLHRERRPESWRTIETLDVAAEVRRDTPRALLVDCLTVWLARVLDEVGAWSDDAGWHDRLAAHTHELIDAFSAATRPVVAVSNEVGQGIVPAEASARLFRDEMGHLNAAVAAAVDEVWFCTAGIPTRLA